VIRGRALFSGPDNRDDRARARITPRWKEQIQPEAHATALADDDDDNNIKAKSQKGQSNRGCREVRLSRLERERASWEVGPVSKKRKEERVRGRSETPRLLAAPL
jgi:hypothetical protein